MRASQAATKKERGHVRGTAVWTKRCPGNGGEWVCRWLNTVLRASVCKEAEGRPPSRSVRSRVQCCADRSPREPQKPFAVFCRLRRPDGISAALVHPRLVLLLLVRSLCRLLLRCGAHA
ncbi:hypothetical protein MTO96_005700 [Rhipicephalus appendiculatus]